MGKGQGTEFNLTFRRGTGKRSETLKFSTEHRTELLTEALVRPGEHAASFHNHFIKLVSVKTHLFRVVIKAL